MYAFRLQLLKLIACHRNCVMVQIIYVYVRMFIPSAFRGDKNTRTVLEIRAAPNFGMHHFKWYWNQQNNTNTRNLVLK